jgi:hypothetical protein
VISFTFRGSWVDVFGQNGEIEKFALERSSIYIQKVPRRRG